MDFTSNDNIFHQEINHSNSFLLPGCSTFKREVKEEEQDTSSSLFFQFPAAFQQKAIPRARQRREAFQKFLERKKEQKKLKRSNMNFPRTIKRDKLIKLINDASKTPLQKLNETGVSYTVNVDPVGNSTNKFQAIGKMNDKSFQGIGSSKQSAKAAIANQMLSYMIGDQAAMDLHRIGEDPLAKTPVSMVNEMFGPNGWNVISEEELQNKGFKCVLKIDRYGEFTGEGISKKDAKQNAAYNGVLNILHVSTLEGYSSEQLNSMIKQFRIEGTVNALPDTAKISETFFKGSKGIAASSSTTVNSNNLPIIKPKTPLQVLHERFGANNVTFDFVGSEGPPNRKIFHVKVKVVGLENEFIANGSSKQEAKQNAAAMVLAALSIDLPRCPSAASDDVKTVENAKISSWADFVANMINCKFQTLTEGTEWNRRTVLAGIVMTDGDNYEASAQVISIATGTKCISASGLSMTGSSVLDCHAEILCRRALCRYFCSHLLAMDNEEYARKAIFEKRKDGKPGFVLKSQFRFHMYVSTAPCGDGRIFAPSQDVISSADKHPNRLNRGLIRTKLESGEGTVPACEEQCQTWDGIMGGDRLVFTSCSDKILLWNHVGIQGNLLSNFIDPVYLTSIIIGSTFNADHLKRALVNRLSNVVHLNEPFHLNSLQILSTSSPEKRLPCKPPKHALLWGVCDRAFEIIDSSTGRLLDTNYSSVVSKQVAFQLFHNVCGKISKLFPDHADAFSQFAQDDSYCKVKEKNEKYCCAKASFINATKREMLGYWPMKPPEIDDFILHSS